MNWKERSRVITPSVSGGWKSRSTPVQTTPKPSAFQRFGGALPVAGSVIGGIAGGGAGTVFGAGVGGVPGAVGGSALGGAAGEAARQMLGRAMGEKSPETMGEAAKKIGVEGLESAAGELMGMGVGKIAGKAYKAFPKGAHMVSGTPAVNVARAQQRGFKVFTPGIGREAAGKAQGDVEQKLIAKFFSPEEQVLLKAKDAGYADELMKSVMLKQIQKVPLTAKEAIGLRILAPVKRAADTVRGISKNIELDKAARGARAAISEQFPQLSQRLGDTEKAITASQLRMPLRVNKTNPNKISGLAMTLGPMLGLPALAATIPFSPLSMGLMGATMGQIKKSVPAVARRAIQRGGIQSLREALGSELE